jgi:hypothetical protein
MFMLFLEMLMSSRNDFADWQSAKIEHTHSGTSWIYVSVFSFFGSIPAAIIDPSLKLSAVCIGLTILSGILCAKENGEYESLQRHGVSSSRYGQNRPR